MSISFIMEMGDLDSENRKVLSGPLSTLHYLFNLCVNCLLFITLYHMHSRKINYTITTTTESVLRKSIIQIRSSLILVVRSRPAPRGDWPP